MKRLSLAVLVSLAALLAIALPAAADGTCIPAFDPGGNGFCADGVSFRAWQAEGGIELKWVVVEDGAEIVIARRVTGGVAGSEVVATSTAAGEFTQLDADVVPGSVYTYQVLRDGEPVGDPIEAGVGTSFVDPGDVSGYRVYIPLTI